MQVNVKELTGVLHLNLVFMIVLVLQSFLAVSLQVCCIKQSKPQANSQHFQVQVSQVFCKCDRCFEPLVQLPSQVTSCVLHTSSPHQEC